MDMEEYYRKVNRFKTSTGSGALISVGKIIPKEWKMVKIIVLRRDKNQIILKIVPI